LKKSIHSNPWRLFKLLPSLPLLCIPQQIFQEFILTKLYSPASSQKKLSDQT